MIRLACLAISLVLHAGIVLLAVWGPSGVPAPSDPGFDVVRVEPLPPPEAALEHPESEDAATPQAPAEADAPTETAGPPTAAQGPAATGPGDMPQTPAPTPGMELISPVKRNMNLPPPLHVGKGQIKTGKVTAMTLRRLAGYDFSLDEFCGHYEVRGEPGRFVDVTRHPADPSALVLRDSNTGMVRTLRRFSTFIFTYGPGFYEDEPVEGSVTFLARKDFERIEDVDERSRLLWQADAPPARVAVRLDVPAGTALPA
ncbi:MAG: hypothetical protein RDU30_13270, partial [Desulfovibrionaceae bacterium]|nr:hypothetical protein [Desulfovibrionaceae bacterium]